MSKSLVVAALFIGASFFSTIEAYARPIPEKIIGRDRDFLLKKWGEPTRKSTSEDGFEVWVYNDQITETTNEGPFNTVSEIGTENYTTASGATATRYKTVERPIFMPGTETKTSCDTSFVIKDKKVQSFSTEGLGCEALK